MTPKRFQNNVLAWFDRSGRKDLPWKKKPVTPYRVWVSEIMLQQTQVTTVIPYFNRWIDQFPTIESVAQASSDAVLSLWSGLGYYARARNLYQTAKQLVANHGGQFPDEVELLEALPGIGRSTAGAILALGMGKKAPILDANVKRVLSRFVALEHPANQAKGNQILWEIAERHTPTHRVSDYTQAMMDLGAFLCTTKNPRCEECPLSSYCRAHKLGQETRYPKRLVTQKKRPVRSVYFHVLVDERGALLFEKRPSKGVWGGLWCFPMSETLWNKALFKKTYLLARIDSLHVLSPFSHALTHFSFHITPIVLKVKAGTIKTYHHWLLQNEWEAFGIPKPVKCLLSTLRRNERV